MSELAANKESKIKSELEKTDTVSVTVDIWTDRRMRGFLGVTAHFMKTEKTSPKLQTILFSCERFTGSHTGERISEKFEEICDNFNIKHKLDYIVCDNASNMKKAFIVCFPSATTESEEDADDVDNDKENSNLWEEISEDYQDPEKLPATAATVLNAFIAACCTRWPEEDKNSDQYTGKDDKILHFTSFNWWAEGSSIGRVMDQGQKGLSACQ